MGLGSNLEPLSVSQARCSGEWAGVNPLLRLFPGH